MTRLNALEGVGRLTLAVILSAGLSFVAGCGSEVDPVQDAKPSRPVGGTAADASAADAGVATADAEPEKSCGEGIYPCGPYGTKNGETLANLKFQALADPEFACKATADQVLDRDAFREVSMKSFHQSVTECGKKPRLLWLMVSAGWCGPCVIEVKETQRDYGEGKFDQRIQLLNVVYETDKRGVPVTKAFLKLWAKNNRFQLTMPVAMDPQFAMAKYFDRNAVPFNMLVDLRTMKIVFRRTGADLAGVGQAAFAYLKENP